MIRASNNPTECTPVRLSQSLGEFASLVALQTAHPTAAAGSYAVVNIPDASDLIYYYSVSDAAWFTYATTDTPFTQLIEIGATTIDGNDITIEAGTIGQLGASVYTTTSPQTFTIPFSSAGKVRTDIIVLNTSSVLVLVPGPEGDIAVQPAIPANTILVTKIEVAEDGIGAVPEPTYLTIDERAAISYANNPNESNPFATMDDLPAPSTPQDLPSVLSEGNRDVFELTTAYTSQTIDKGRFLFVQSVSVVIDVDDAQHANGDELDIQNQRTNGLQITLLGSAVFLDSSNVVLVPPSGRILLKKLATNNWTYSIINSSRILNLENILGSGFGSIMHVADTFEFVNGSGNLIYSLEPAFLNIFKALGIFGKLSMNNLTDYRLFNFPDEDGTVALQSYVDNKVAGLLDLRGNYDASGNVFPSTGGSGTAGAILKGDFWYISVAGTLGGEAVHVGDSIYAKIDSPTSSDWEILEANLSYVPEDVANKTDTMSGNTASSTKYLSAKGVFDYIASVLVNATASVRGIVKLYTSTGSNTDGTMDQNSITNALALKQNKYTNGLEYFNDFESSIPTTANGSLFGISMDGRIGKFGNGTSITYPNIPSSTSVHIGAPLLQSTAVNSWTGVGGNPLQGILLGNGIFEFNTLIQLNNLPDVTNQVTSLFGLNDTINQTVSAVNAIAFVLENVNVTTAPSGSINWQCMTINSGVKTTTITSVAMSTNWVKLSIIINANASSVDFYIDNVLVATHTTNIPTARLAIYTALNKRNIGTISMGYYIDYLHYKYDYTTKRL